MSLPERFNKRLEALYLAQDCETGSTWNPVVQSVPLAHVGPHIIVACYVHKTTLKWYFSWYERILWLVSE